MQIENDTVVSIDYTLTGPDGKVIDTSDGREPLAYLHGAGNIIPGLERELTGKNVGDAVKVTIQPADAYGMRDDKMIQRVPRKMFQGVHDIKPGMQFTASGPNGQQRMVTVTQVEPEEVTVDANHPLAGMPLTFNVKIASVRAATDAEKSHKHPHGPGGHHH